MGVLNVPVPDAWTDRLKKRAREEGYSSVEAFTQAWLQEQAGEPPDPELEAILLERDRDASGEIEFNEEFRQAFAEQVRQRRANSGKAP